MLIDNINSILSMVDMLHLWISSSIVDQVRHTLEVPGACKKACLGLNFRVIFYPSPIRIATQAALTISCQLQPRERSIMGLARPCSIGPVAVAPAKRSVIL